jgi:hypothetical protein
VTDVDAIRRRAEKATPGPWVHDTAKNDEHDTSAPDLVVGPAPDYATLMLIQPRIGQEYRDASFVAHAREDIPALLTEVTRLRNALEELADAADSVHVYPEGSFGFDDLNAACVAARRLLNGEAEVAS